MVPKKVGGGAKYCCHARAPETLGTPFGAMLISFEALLDVRPAPHAAVGEDGVVPAP